MNTTVHQQQVIQGGIIRANKRWRNVGASGTRDIYALYGTGLTLETFVAEFGAVAVDRYCAAGAEVTTPVDCTVPVGASPGLRNALVGVAEYVYPTIIFDDCEIVPNAIEVLPATGMVSITVTNKNAPAHAVYWAGLTSPTIVHCPFTPIGEDFHWTIKPDELTSFLSYDATFNPIDTPNAGLYLGWDTFKDGALYTWNFATGLLELTKLL